MALNPLIVRNFANSLILSKRFGRFVGFNRNVARNPFVTSHVQMDTNLINITRFYAKAKSVRQGKKETSHAQPAKIEKFTEQDAKSLSTHEALLMVELLMQPQNKLPPLIKQDEEARSSLVPDVTQFFQNPANRTPGGFHHVLNSAAYAHDLEKGKELFKKMKELNVEPSEYLFSLFIDTSRKDMAQSFKYLEEMKAMNLAPNLRVFTALIQSCISGRNLDKAFEVLQTMTADGILPDKILYSTLIDGCRKLKDYKRAWDIFDTSRQTGLVVPDSVMYTSMIHVCAKTDQAERALNLLEEMKMMNLIPTEVTYNAALYATSSRRDKYRDTLMLLGQMKADGYAPDFITLNTVLHAAAVAGDTASAERLVQEINSLKDMKPDLITYNSLLHAYATSQIHYVSTPHLRVQFERAEEILTIMRQNGIQPDQMSYTQVLCAYTRSLFLDRAWARYLKLKEEGLQDDAYVYSHLISMYSRARAVDKCFELYEEMQQKGIVPLSSTIVSLMFVSAKNKKYKAALAILKTGVELGYTFTYGHVVPLIALLRELKMPEYIHEVLTSTGLKEKELHIKVQEYIEERERHRLALEAKQSNMKTIAGEERDEELVRLAAKEEEKIAQEKSNQEKQQ